MALLVTGAMGHVGYAVARHAAAQGLPVIAQYLNTFDKAAADRLGPNVTWARCDLSDAFELATLALKYDIDGCIHGAALPNDKTARPVPQRAFQSNIAAVQHLLEIGRQSGWRRFVLVSSGAVFQRWTDTTKSIRETDPASPVNVYGTTKHCAELLTSMYSEIYKLSAATVRVSWIYGPPLVPKQFDGPRGPIPDFLRRALRGEAIDEPSGGEFAASFTHVDDCALGLLAVYRADKLGFSLYNLGSGENYTTARVADAVRACVPNAKVRVGGGSKPWTDFTVLRGPLNCDRMREDVGFKPTMTLEQGVANFAEWMKKNPEVLC